MSVKLSTSTHEGLDVSWYVVPCGTFFLFKRLCKTIPKVVINLAVQCWLRSTHLDYQTQCQEAWCEPVFLGGLSCDGDLGRWTHCSCCAPRCLLQNLIPSSASPCLSGSFNLFFDSGTFHSPKNNFLQSTTLHQEALWKRSCPSPAPRPQNHSLTLCSLASATPAAQKDSVQGCQLPPSC